MLRLVIAVVMVLAALPVAPATAEVLVSLGDSYSSGEGARDRGYPDWDRGTGGGRRGNECHRSPNAWPRRLGVAEDRHFACSGAKIADVLDRGQKRLAPDNVPQLARLVELDGQLEIDTVLLTIGGNDMDFVGKLRACFVGHKCLRDLDKLDRDLEALKPKLVDAYGRVADATWGFLVVVGYPDIFPSRNESFVSCGWLGDNEKTGVWRLQAGLDRVIREAAEEADVDFISIRDALDGRELCTKDSYVNKIGLTGGSDRGHPNSAGQRLMARAVRRGLDALDADVGDAAASRWRACGDLVFEPRTEYGAFDVRAKGTRCRTARRVAAASRATSVVDGPFVYTVGRFRCRGTPTEDVLPAVDWKCRRKRARVRFTRG